jgi:hypothetical protein
MIAQAELQGKLERLPWILVVAGHGDRKPIATLELSVLLELVYAAGLVARPSSAGQLRAFDANVPS